MTYNHALILGGVNAPGLGIVGVHLLIEVYYPIPFLLGLLDILNHLLQLNYSFLSFGILELFGVFDRPLDYLVAFVDSPQQASVHDVGPEVNVESFSSLLYS